MKKSKKFLWLFLCLLFLCPLSMPTSALAAEQKVMRVGWFTQDCYQEMTQAGKPYGFNYEYLMYIAQYTGWKYEFVAADSFAECYEMMKNGQIDMMGYLLYSDERAAEVAFPEKNCGYAATSLYVRADSSLAAYDFESFNGLRVACMESKNLDYFIEYAKKNHFSSETVLYTSVEEIERAVENREVDAGICAGYQPGDQTRIIASFSSKPFYFVVQKSDGESLEELNEALDMLKIENPLLDRELAYKYLPEVSNTLHLTQEEKRYVEDHGVIMVTYQKDWFPIAWTNPESGKFEGIVADVFNRISALTGLKFRYREATVNDTSPIQASTIHNTTSYADGLWLSNAYLNVPLVLVQRKNLAEGTAKSTAIMHQLYRNFDVYALTDQKAICYDTFDECLQSVLNGETDQAILNSYASEQLLKQTQYRDLEADVLYNRAYDLCIGINDSENPLLLSIVNKGLGVISSADMSAIINQNLSKAFDINLSTIVAYMPTDVIALLILVLFVMVMLAFSILWKQVRYAKNMKKLLCTDELTGILSMKGFELELQNRIHHLGDQKAFLVDFDINHFGDYNAINGYKKGDEILCSIAQILQENSGVNELYARVQADRFVCLWFENTPDEIKKRIACEQQKFLIRTEVNCLLFSYGIYEIRDENEDISVMCDCALLAKRSVKGNYQCNIAVYDEVLYKKKLSNTELLDAFQAALQEGEFIHYYQPKYAVETQELVGAEALVRWMRNSEIVQPGQFIDLFESNGLIAKLDLSMFEKLCKKLSVCLKHKIAPVPISINFSRVHLFDECFADKLSKMVEIYEIPPELIEIEITETAFAEGRSAMIQTIEDLHRIGFLVSIDDFGSGFSSLNTLKDANFDIIKLDRDFLNAAEQTKREENIIARIIELAKDLKIKTVAEGVETGIQYEMMKRCGCDIIQGYYFSPPVTEREFDLILKKAGTDILGNEQNLAVE